MDHGAFGNLLIGLRAIEAETQVHRPRRSVTAQRRVRDRIRVALASGLQRAAFALDRPTVSEATTR